MKFTYMVAGYLAYYVNMSLVLILFLNLFFINYFEIYSDRETTSRIVRRFDDHRAKKYIYTRHLNGKDVYTGVYLHWTFVAFVDRRENVNETISIFTTQSHYKQLIEETEAVASVAPVFKEDCTQITVYIRKGTYKCFYYNHIRLNVAHISPLGGQAHVVDSIVDIYKQKGRATIFLHGVSSAGKSTVGYLVAKAFNGKFCHSFNPSEPGDHLTTLITDADLDSTVLVVVLEEVDVMIKNIHEGDVHHNLDVPTLVYNKPTWTNFLDDMFFYKNVILIMTSNTPKTEIDDLDEAYLRPGRIHASFSMTEKIIL
jgi:hypothetical protein